MEMVMNNETMVLLEKYFDVAFAAPNGVKKLRKLILSLAMQGKLVAQDPHDVPASMLLKEIETEKNRLVKSGKIKPSKSLQPKTKPTTFPKIWELVSLENVSTKIHYGFTASANHDLKDVRLLRITDIQDNKVDWESVPSCDTEGKDVTQYLLANKDILIARTGGTVGKSYLVENINVKAVFASYLIRVVPSEHIDVNYLKLFLGSPLYWKQLYAKCSGTGQPNVNGTSLSTLLLPLPPLAEQRRIVAKIDELMARCDELEKLRGNLNQKQITVHNAALNRLLTAKDQSDFNTAWQFITQHFGDLYSVKENVAELRKAILQLAVMGKLVPQDPSDRPASELLKEIEKEKQGLVKEGKFKEQKTLPEIRPEEMPYALPKEWKWVRLGQLLPDYQNGLSKRNSSEGVEKIVIRLADIKLGEVSLDDHRLIRLTDEESQRYELTTHDILITRVNGSTDLIGNFTLIKRPDRLIYCDHFIRLRISQDFITSIYLCKVAKSSLLREQITSKFVTTAGQKTVNQSHIASLILPLPPLAEQHRIVAKCDQLMALCDNLEKQIDETNSKKTNLLNAVMTKV